MIRRSAILLEHVSWFSYCLLIIKLYWGVKWITIKKKKKSLLVQVQIQKYSRKLPFLWPQRNIAAFYQFSSVSTKALSHHPAQPYVPAGCLFRATYCCSLYTDEWREYCYFSVKKRAHTLAAAAPRSTKSWVSNLTFSCPWWESRPCCEKQSVIQTDTLPVVVFAHLEDCHDTDIYHRCNQAVRSSK